MPDLAQQIRDRLDAWAHPTAIIETPEPLSPAEYAEFITRFAATQQDPERHHKIVLIPHAGPSPFDQTRAALLGALGFHPYTPAGIVDGRVLAVCNGCNVPFPCREVQFIARALGIEVSDATA